MASLSAAAAAIVATAPPRPPPRGAPIPPLFTAKPRGDRKLHLAPAQPARGLDPRGLRAGCPAARSPCQARAAAGPNPGAAAAAPLATIQHSALATVALA